MIITTLYSYRYYNKPDLLYVNTSEKDIIVDYPKPNFDVLSSFEITGRARGIFYFEASFPVSVFNKNDKLLLQTFATAKGDWMTEKFVPFSSNISLGDYKGKVKIVMKKDNPSGDADKDASVSFYLNVK
jgi:hypothetical protein